MKRATVKLTLALSLLAGALFTAVPSQADPDCKKDRDSGCILVYDPVICDNNKIYSNSCFAQLDCARNCVPYLPLAE